MTKEIFKGSQRKITPAKIPMVSQKNVGASFCEERTEGNEMPAQN